jgi:hypothetical protein
MLVAAAVSAVLAGAGSAHAATFDLVSGGPVHLDQLLIAGNSATVGNLQFTFTPASFLSSVLGGVGGAPSASNILVSAFTSVPGEPGITFTAGWTAGDGLGHAGEVDTKFSFQVSTLNGVLINDDYLSTTGSTTDSSRWDVAETVSTSGGTLANFAVTSLPNSVGQTVTATATFAPTSVLTVSKDIHLQSPAPGGTVNGVAFISDVSQGFSTPTVPVPAAAWAGFSMLGGLGLFGVARRRRMA